MTHFYKLYTAEELDRETLMDDFIKHDCVCCGGNWTAMLISGLKNRYYDIWELLDDDRQYTFFEMCDIVYNVLDDIVNSRKRENNNYLRETLAYHIIERGTLIGQYIRNNAYTSCGEYVYAYCGNYFYIRDVDGMVITLRKSTETEGKNLHYKTRLRYYE